MTRDHIALAAQYGIMKPNEGRVNLNLPPVEGGDVPNLAQQHFHMPTPKLERRNDDSARYDNYQLAQDRNAMAWGFVSQGLSESIAKSERRFVAVRMNPPHKREVGRRTFVFTYLIVERSADNGRY
jgi:hypothetical protein